MRELTPLAEVGAAVSFLTRLPIPRSLLVGDRTGAAAFGLVGGLLGGVAALPLVLAGATHQVPAAVGSLAILAVLSGGLHLDGLGDTADALAAPSGIAERARTDPRAGTAGVIAVVLVLLLDAALLAELAAAGPPVAAAALIAAASASRAAAPVAASLAGRRWAAKGGLGAWFAERVGPVPAAASVAVAVAIAVVAGRAADRAILAGLAAGAVLALVLGAAIVRLRGRLDGDGYGTLVELTLAASLAGMVATTTTGPAGA